MSDDQRELFPPEQSTEPCASLATIRAGVRASDPVTSHEAAERVDRRLAPQQRALVLQMVVQHPGLSSRQLAASMVGGDGLNAEGLDRYIFARRLPELRAAGLVGHKRLSPPTGVCREDTECDGTIRTERFNSVIHERADDGASAWWPVNCEEENKGC